MKKWFLFFGLAMIGLAFGCGDDNGGTTAPEETSLTLNFQAAFGDQPLVMYAETYDYEDGMRVRFQTFQFYVSNLTLLRQTDGGMEEVPVLPVELVAFNDIQSTEAAEKGVDVVIDNVPTGTYQGIRFSLGVDTILNMNTRPEDYEVGHPLTKNYWSWARGYIFTSIEGQADLAGNGEFTGIGYHAGDDNTLYRTLTFNRTIDLTREEGASLAFEVDLRRVLVHGTGDFLDFRTNQILHADSDGFFGYITDGLESALSLE